MTGAAAEEPRFSLLEIEAAQAELVAARMDAELIEDPEERAAALVAVEQAVTEYAAREVQKVDSYRRLIRALTFALAASKDERDRQAARASVIQNLIESIKEGGRRAMEVCGKKRIDGRTGSLILKGNGGVQPLVKDAKLIPKDLMRVTVRMPLDLFERREEEYGYVSMGIAEVIEVQPWDEKIREALGMACQLCGGLGTKCPSGPSDAPMEVCPACGGSGRNSVPGAYLGERGNHIEVR